jgi:hypothetical protein
MRAMATARPLSLLRRTAAVTAITTACLGAVAAAGARVAAAPPPTTIAGDVVVAPGNVRTVALSGVLASRRAGQPLTLQARHCGRGNHFRAVAGTRSGTGGAWRLQTTADSGTFFRVRVGRRFSRTLTFRSPLTLDTSVGPEGHVVVSLNTWTTGQNMARRQIELQQRTETGWLHLRTLRLALWRVPAAAPHTYIAVTLVRERGLRLRIVVPASSAAPCYAETISPEFVS